MKTVWYIARKDLLQTFKDRGSIIFMLAIPMILIAVLGSALTNIGGSSGPIQVTVAVSNQDSGYVGQTLEKVLDINTNQLHITVKNYSDSQQVTTVVGDSNSGVNAGVVIPAGTSDALVQAAQNNAQTSNLVKFYALPNSNDARITLVQDLVTGTVNQLVTAQFAGTEAVKQVESVCNQPGNH